jgi:hypothetical protein
LVGRVLQVSRIASGRGDVVADTAQLRYRLAAIPGPGQPLTTAEADGDAGLRVSREAVAVPLRRADPAQPKELQMSSPTLAEVPAPARETADPRRWRALAVTQIAAFMILLDVSIVNVALPSSGWCPATRWPWGWHWYRPAASVTPSAGAGCS